jgi:hypothetical protein
VGESLQLLFCGRVGVGCDADADADGGHSGAASGLTGR